MRGKPRATVPEPSRRVIDLQPLSLRAKVEAATADDESRTVELVWSTGADVERTDWWTGDRYVERLSLKPGHVRLERLNSGGAPLLDAHSAWSISDQIGVVEPDTVRLTAKEARATVRFSKRDAVDPIWGDVRDKIIKNVSVGYRVHKFEEERSGNKIPIRTAVDWEPYEISMVPMPADAGAQVRGGDKSQTNQCVIETRGDVKERPMRDDERSETIAEDNPLTPPAKRTPEPQPEPDENAETRAEERARCQGIYLACRAARLPQSTADKLVADGTSLVDAQSYVFRELAKRGGQDRGPAPGPSGTADAIVGEDPLVHVREGIEEALLHRVRPKTAGDPKGFELTDKGRPYRGMTMLRIAEAYLHQRGVRTSSLGKMQIAAQALGLTERAHTTSDFPLLLADVANKTLRRAYEEAPQTWAPISRRTTLPDFKPVKRLQIGEAPALLEVGEHGEFTFGTIGEGREQFQLATYGRRFAITRKALVNDDTDAFSRVPTLFGRAARNLESDTVWTQITSNPVMGDGVVLFHATHANLAGAGAVISVATIGAGRAAMRIQKGVDLVTLLNIFPAFLIVPAALETVADQFVSQNLLASSSTSVNPFAGRLQVIAEPRLDANSLISWYLASTPDQIDIIEYAYLEGEEGPMVESRVGWEVDGLEIKCREDFAAKVIDYRGLWKNPGA